MSVHFSSSSCEWGTPKAFFDALDRTFNFCLDPCANADNAKCEKYFTPYDNGLAQDWNLAAGGGAVFMNPPYGRGIGAWVKKAYETAQKGNTVVCLLPARTDTRWWQEYCSKGLIKFIAGRLKFGDSKNSAPFPSALVIFLAESQIA